MSEWVVRRLGLLEYEPVWRAMQDFTSNRGEKDRDEAWFLEHPPVFTQGQAGKAEHLLAPGNIPIVQVDRGGQVTYHGPGQLVVYLLFDIGRQHMGSRELVSKIEEALITLLSVYGLSARIKPKAPGVYIGEAKIASLGLRIRKGRSFHGLSLNVDMDLEPFDRINPCGYAGMPMTQIADFNKECTFLDVANDLQNILQSVFGYTQTALKDSLPILLNP